MGNGEGYSCLLWVELWWNFMIIIYFWMNKVYFICFNGFEDKVIV